MQITLTGEMEEMIKRRMSSGEFSSPGDVIKEGLMLLNEQEEFIHASFNDIKAKIDEGLRQSDSGLSEPLDAEEIKREGRRILNDRRMR